MVQPGAAPSHQPGTESIQLDGVISNMRGNTFELLVAGGIRHVVQTDAQTALSGELVTGATVAVSGTKTGNGNIHAVAVTVIDAAELSEPPQAEATKMAPPGQADKTKSPSDKTPGAKTPGPPSTPPGQGGGNGNGSENVKPSIETPPGNGNGNAGGNGGGTNGRGGD